MTDTLAIGVLVENKAARSASCRLRRVVLLCCEYVAVFHSRGWFDLPLSICLVLWGCRYICDGVNGCFVSTWRVGAGD